MNTRAPHASYPLGLVLFALSLAIYKSLSLTVSMDANWYRFVILLGLDSPFLSFLSLLALLQAHLRMSWLRIVFWLPMVFLTFYYLVDSFVLLALNEHVSLFEVGRYVPEWGVVLSFFDATAYAAIFLFLVSIPVLFKATASVKKSAFVIFLTTVLLAGWGVVNAPWLLRTYAVLNPWELLESVEQGEPMAVYSDEEVEFYSGFKRVPVSVPVTKPNIILLIMESLSSINSERASGRPGFLEGFDELSKEGVLFTNFFANHQASEGGLIALLGGFPPMHYPTATPYMFDEFAFQASVVDEYRQRGYSTEFLTNADLSFIGLDRFLGGLGVDRSRGRDEVDSMRLAPRVVQDAPSDAYLYHEALLSVRSLLDSEQPFLLTIATTSTHLPYTHPEGGPDTPAAVWEWSLRQLQDFYSGLVENGYFDNGLLLVTGDHRQMRPLSDLEIERYGGSAQARVPLLVVGEPFPRDQIDHRFFQQSDLLRHLGRIHRKGEHLSPHPIWVERYNRKYGRIELIDKLSVFDEADQGRIEYRLRVPGNRIQWLAEKPVFAGRLETRIHSQRSLHQKAREILNHQPAENP